MPVSLSGSLLITGSLTVTEGIIMSGSIASASFATNASLLNGTGSGDFTSVNSFNSYTSSTDTKIASINTTTGSQNTRLSALETASGSAITRLGALEVASGSAITRLSALETASGSAITRLSSLETASGSAITRLSALEVASGSAITRLSSLETASGSAITRLSSLENKTGSYATTGSNNFNGTQTITGSLLQSGNYTTTGTITAQTINVQQVTSSIVYSSGSNIFGNAIGNTQTFTGSVNITGSLSLNSITIPTSASLASTYLPLAGGTLTGPLTGSSAVFSGNVRRQSSSTVNTELQSDGIYATGTDLYLLAPSGRFVSIYSNNAEAVRITSSGSIGIGTTSPAALLHVSQPGGNTQLKIGNNTTYDQFIYFNGNSDWSIGIDYSNSNAFVISNNSSLGTNDRVVLTTGGNVGIGTTSPSQKLDVVGRFNANGVDYHSLVVAEGSAQLRLERTSTSTGLMYIGADNIGFKVFDSAFATRLTLTSGGNLGIGTTSPTGSLHVRSSDGTVRFASSTGNDAGRIILMEGALDAWSMDGGLANGTFLIRDEYNSSTRLAINNVGNVGIGTTSPSGKLDIWGLNDYNQLWIRATTGNAAINFDVETSASSYYNWRIDAQGLVGNAICITPSTAAGGTTFTSPVMTITQGGNVGIGTTSPNSTLSVQGNTNLGNSYANTLSSTYTTKISGYSLRYDASNRYGDYGVLILNSDSSWTGGARKFMLTSGLNATKFAIIRSTDANTDPSLGDGGVVSSGTADFVINNGGNVGIGTTDPAYRLDVVGPSGDVARFTDGTYSLKPYLGSTYKIFQTNDNDQFGFYGTQFYVTTNGGSERLRIDNGGNVGIGTTSPIHKLNIFGTVGSGTVTPQETLVHIGGNELGSSGGYAGIRLGGAGNATSYGVYIRGVKQGSYGDYWNTALTFNVTRTSTDTTVDEAMRITSDSRVGIGTTSPGYKLEVAGNVRIQDTLSLTNGDSGQAVFTNNSTAVSVSTTTALGGSFSMGGSGAFVIVYGSQSTNVFIDTIIAANTGTPTVLNSTTVSGSPSARTYSTASNRLQLAMASGTYDVRINILRIT
jgi:hypothetical protein